MELEQDFSVTPDEVVCALCGKPVTPAEAVHEGEKSFHLACYRLSKRPR